MAAGLGTSGIMPWWVRPVEHFGDDAVQRPEHLVAARFEERLVEDLVRQQVRVEISRAAMHHHVRHRGRHNPALVRVRASRGQRCGCRFAPAPQLRERHQLGGAVAGLEPPPDQPGIKDVPLVGWLNRDARITLFSVLLPVGLMMGKALVDIFIDDEGNPLRQTFDILGRPLVALLIAVVVGIFTLGRGAAMTRDQIVKCLETSLPPVAGIILIVAAGGGFKNVLVDTGIGTMLADWAKNTGISVILLAWVLAVLIRLATGSATVATITASSLMLGLVEGMSTGQVSLVVLAVGAGSLFFSHVNDAGFWLVKEYFGMTRGSDHQVVVDHGDSAVGHRAGAGAAARDRDLTIA